MTRSNGCGASVLFVHGFRRGNRPGLRLGGLTVMLTGILAAAPSVARAGCNLIPTDPDRFQSVIGATNRPFAGPGETLEIAVVSNGCDARSAGVSSREAASYVATYVFKPAAGSPAHVVVVTQDCASRGAALDACRNSEDVGEVTCRPLAGDGAVRNIELLERKGVPVFSLRFPDTDVFVEQPHDGRTLTGPVAVALTNAADPLPCGLAASACAALPDGERLVACVDEMHVSDGTCAVSADTRHSAFPRFLALPPTNALAKTVPGSGVTNVAFSGAEMLATADGDGNLLVPVDWRTAAAESGQPLRGRHALDALGARLGSAQPLASSSVSAFTAWGRPLPALHDAAQPDGTRSLFDLLDVPLTVLRVAARTCAAGSAVGRACSAGADCPDSVCGAPAFESNPGGNGPVVLLPVAAAPSPAPPAAVESQISDAGTQTTAAAY